MGMQGRTMLTPRFLTSEHSRLKAVMERHNDQYPHEKTSMNKICIEATMERVEDMEYKQRALDAQQYGGNR